MSAEPAADLEQAVGSPEPTSTKKTFRPKKLPFNLASSNFLDDMDANYDWLLEHDPVHKGKASILKGHMVSRYADCMTILKDGERFSRLKGKPHGKEGGGGYWMPKSIAHLTQGLVNTDDPQHRRLRDLVHRAFTSRALKALEGGIEAQTKLLLDKMGNEKSVDLIATYTKPLPIKIIADMMGIAEKDMPPFTEGIGALTNGLTGLSIFKSLFWDIPKLDKFVRKLVAQKKTNLGEDILSGLVQAELEGDSLSDDELATMVFILTIAGFETTVFLIANVILMLLMHPEQKALALSDPKMLDAAIEETLRFHGSVTGSEAHYAMEDVTLSGVTIKKGEAVFAVLAAGNRDPRVFENPHLFDMTRSPNKHLGFGQGIHYCVGAPLARMETRIAITNLFARYPNLSLAVEPHELEVQPVPFFRRYKTLPVNLNR